LTGPHFAQVGPPQSTSVSAPFFTVSSHVPSAQIPAAQIPEIQSPPNPQCFVTAQGLQVPPQSLSVSEPFLTPSVHVGAWHVDVLDWHTPETQSVPALQRCPFWQGAQVVPPQSMSVSLPLKTPSMHAGSWHLSSTQVRCKQSVRSKHFFRSPQGEQACPPQSTSVSVPFFTASLQLGAAHLPDTHDELTQSLSILHFEFTEHGKHAPPPQFKSVSVPFATASVQLGA
jgi:hypothetical protein